MQCCGHGAQVERRAPDAAQRVALAERCAAEPGSRLLATRRNRGPGSAKQRFAKCYAPHRARDTWLRFSFRFKQPRLVVLAAQYVRGLPVPREPREAMERWEAPGHQRAPLEAGGEPTSRGKAPRAPKARRSASQRSTGHQAIDRSGAPRSGQLSLCPLKDRF